MKTLESASAFYAPPGCFQKDRVTFPPEEEHHLRQVLRIGPGAVVEVLDGCGGRYSVALLDQAKTAPLGGRVLSAQRELPALPRISVALALGRRERMKLAVEKLAELGCHKILPLFTEYVAVLGNPGPLVDKLRLVCRSALKQSRTPFLTSVDLPVAFDSFLEMVREKLYRPVICKRNAIAPVSGTHQLPELARDGEYCLVVGPEGGFSPLESDRLAALGATAVHLGGHVLRFETAAVAGYVLLRRLLHEDLYFY